MGSLGRLVPTSSRPRNSNRAPLTHLRPAWRPAPRLRISDGPFRSAPADDGTEKWVPAVSSEGSAAAVSRSGPALGAQPRTVRLAAPLALGMFDVIAVAVLTLIRLDASKHLRVGAIEDSTQQLLLKDLRSRN